MDNFDIVGVLRTYATTQGWLFLYGSNAYQNIEADAAISQEQLVLTADFTARPTYTNGRVMTIQYNGVMMLGRKSEIEGTFSSLDETMIQKYDRRLLELMQLLSNALGSIACSNELEISSANFRLDINKFDTNIDFIAGEVTLVQG
jgi:hypothetical protein